VKALAVPMLCAALAALSTLSNSTSPTGAAIDRTSRTIPLDASTPIRIDATIAEVTIVGSDRPDLSVDVVRHAPAETDLARFPVAIETTAEGVHVSVVQADGGRDAALKSEITVAAPLSATLQAVRVFEGRVTLANLHAACDVDLRRGAIEASGLAGRIRLEAGIGSLDVRDSELTAGGMMRLRVFNGPLRVRFAKPPVNARILAVTFNGRLTSDIPLTRKDRFGPRFGETTIGTGDPVLSMDVVKGDIAIELRQKSEVRRQKGAPYF
jgi:hypothetical protein